MITRQYAMRLWRKHGGSQHGPRVETVTMPLDQFHDFVADLINAAITAATHPAQAPVEEE